MINLVDSILPRLQANRLNGLDLGPGALVPAYHGYSLLNIPGSVCQWLGAPVLGEAALAGEIRAPLGGPFRNVILMLIDGLGLNFFRRSLQAPGNPLSAALQDAVLAPLTSIVPSTTATALTTLWTGRSPAAHGVLGYEVFLKEYGMIANMILHSAATAQTDVGGLRRSGFDPATFLPVPTLAGHLLEHGVPTFAFQPNAISRSGLSTMLLDLAEVIGYRANSDLWVTLRERMEKRAGQPGYYYVYWSNVDDLSHRFGPDDVRVEMEWADFSAQLARFIAAARGSTRGDTLLVITADHGQIVTPRRAEAELKNHPQLGATLSMQPSGESRLPYVYLRSGQEAAFEAYLRQAWGGAFRSVPPAEALDAGLFGPGEVYPRTRERLGDRVVIPPDTQYWWWADKDNPLLGRHGGVHPDEMLVPFVGLVI